MSRDLVEYRMKVSRLWQDYKAQHPEEIQRRYEQQNGYRRNAEGRVQNDELKK